jgi:hypothetical protein
MTRSLALQPHKWPIFIFAICDILDCDILMPDISICDFAIFLMYLVTFRYMFVPVVLTCSLYLDLALFTMWHHSTIVVSVLGRTISRIELSFVPSSQSSSRTAKALVELRVRY